VLPQILLLGVFGPSALGPAPQENRTLIQAPGLSDVYQRKRILLAKSREALLMQGWHFNRRSWDLSYDWDGALDRVLKSESAPVIYGQQIDMIHFYLEDLGYIRIHRDRGLRIIGGAKRRIRPSDVDQIIKRFESILYDATLTAVEAPR